MTSRDEAFDHPPTFVTDRLLVRPIATSDAEAIFRMKSDTEVAYRYGAEPHSSFEQTKTWVAERLADLRRRDSILWVLTLRADKSYSAIGSCCYWNFVHPSNFAELGYELGRAYWGKGLMSEALPPVLEFGFRQLGLHRIEADPLAENEPSKKVLTKLGFKLEGNLRERMLFGEQYRDQLVFGLLKEEWIATRRRAFGQY